MKDINLKLEFEAKEVSKEWWRADYKIQFDNNPVDSGQINSTSYENCIEIAMQIYRELKKDYCK